MWRRFIAEIAVICAVLTVLVTLVTVRISGGEAPAPDARPADPDWHCSSEPVRAQSNTKARGYGRLCIGDRVVSVALDAVGLMPGHLHEGWLVYVDSTKACAASPCPLTDLLRAEPPAVFTRIGAAITSEDGRVGFAQSFRGMTPTQASQLQLLLVDHGAAIVGEGHIHQLLIPRWSPAGDVSPTMVLVASGHFTVRRLWDATD